MKNTRISVFFRSRTVNKEWDSGFGLVTGWVSENNSGIVKRKASCSFIALAHSELQIFRSKAKLKFWSLLILIWILRGLEPNRYVQRYKQHHGKILLGTSHLNGHTLEFYPQTQKIELPWTTLYSIINSATGTYCSVAFIWSVITL